MIQTCSVYAKLFAKLLRSDVSIDNLMSISFDLTFHGHVSIPVAPAGSAVCVPSFNSVTGLTDWLLPGAQMVCIEAEHIRIHHCS